ncbi:MAG: SUMF1/EgtB/PvdO family nonheme iron enzyme [Planctomycetota bacterium]|nr:SUMF1/EgtB/PvdO family nonheme iron enzyme [Planctomycetota bacterium]
MNSKAIEDLIHASESERLEFRGTDVDSDRIATTVCAFLNTAGGAVVVGVCEGGVVEPVQNADCRVLEIKESLSHAISPSALWSVSTDATSQGDVVTIDVPAGRDRPYVCQGAIYIRNGVQTVAADAETIRRLIRQQYVAPTRWERLAAAGLELDDLDQREIWKTVAEAQRARNYAFRNVTEILDVLADLGVRQAGQLTNGADVLFAENPSHRLTQTRVRATVYATDKTGDFVDDRLFEGHAVSLVEQLVAFLDRHVTIASEFKAGKIAREDRPQYPFAALREGVINAIVHRDYAAFAGGMTVGIYSNRIEIWNTGKLPAGLCISDLQEIHPSLPANPDMAHVLYLRGIIERVGRGTLKILEECKALGLRPPQWEESATGITLVVFGKEPVHRLVPSPPPAPSEQTDPTAYLRDLLDQTSQIEIRGVKAGRGEAYRFPIEDLFISLTTTGSGLRESGEANSTGRNHSKPGLSVELGTEASAPIPLHHALRHDRLVVVGDPGAGKTTFLRRVVHTLCQTHLGDLPGAANERLGVADRTFPVFVRLSALAQHLARHADSRDAPAEDDAPAWLPHYLAAAGQGNHLGLNQTFFQRQLEVGVCTVLLDGLDEAPDRLARERLSRLIRNATRAYADCRFVVTSRPAAYVDDVVLPGFAHARIDVLGDDAVATFLARWCDAVYRNIPASAAQHSAELLSALRARPEIRRMARNPVMLTALAVVHWNERRLPEQRADLYQSIITWLSRSREQRAGRATADRTVELLQELAWEMQNDSGGRKMQLPKREAAEKLLPQFARAGKKRHLPLQLAERFLDEEEVDSGIIVGRGNEVAFWHLTFQEFLAAKAVSSRLEDAQQKMLLGDAAKLYSPDWREVVLLLAGILHEQGRSKVDGFVSGLLERLGHNPPLADQARCFGLLGAVLSDLAPLRYTVSDPRYPGLASAVTAIFDRERSVNVPLETRIAAADALGQAGDPRLDHHRDDYWVRIPASRFVIGAQSKCQGPNYDAQAFDDRESPPHAVSLDAFCIARYPLTVGQYQRFIADDGYGEEHWWSAGGFGKFTTPEKWDQQQPNPSRPVVGVSWFEAAAFCSWAACRLPTEAEWERAARGTTGRKYPWGDEPAEPERLNFSDSRLGHPTPVGIYPLGTTPEGICDLAGNVWEWCADGYGEYAVTALTNPRGLEQAAFRVLRGGNWGYDARICRAAYRIGDVPGLRAGHLGFRVARGPSG